MTDTPIPEDIKATAGSIIVFATGEYSDYQYTGHFVALEVITSTDFAKAKAVAEAKQAEENDACESWSPKDGTPYPRTGSKHEKFIAALIKAGLLAAIAVNEHHIGSYGEIDCA